MAKMMMLTGREEPSRPAPRLSTSNHKKRLQVISPSTTLLHSLLSRALACSLAFKFPTPL
ncbi:hypothetical protein N7463_008459 [Penicillium fimorum]|uniref:Uncharacterized protein n=1 Tax=Penicillium fimorum TaxID=1882269 RepID=A0A9W9XNW7_9EURO|nr:hypothetical protein N7463_008459 [Penicillium fimorum]